MSPRTQTRLAVALLVIATLVLFGQRLDAPFDWTHRGWNGSYYGIAARNFLRYGYLDLGFMHCIEAGAVVDNPAMYLRHPPMNSVLASGFLYLFGDSEFSLRLAPLLLSLASALVLFLWMQRLFPGRPWLAAATSICAAAVPNWALYGSMLEPLGSGVILSVLGSLYFVDRWLETHKHRDQVLALAFLLFGCLYDWAAFYTAGFLGVILWWSFGRRGWRVACLYWGFALASASLIFAWIFSLGRTQGVGLPQMAGFASHRNGWLGTIYDDGGNIITLGDLFQKILDLHVEHFYVPLTILGLIASVLLAIRVLRTHGDARTPLLLVPLFVGLFHVLIFPQGAFVHAYWQVYLAPGLVIPIFVVLGSWTARRSHIRFDIAWVVLTLVLSAQTVVIVRDHLESKEPSIHLAEEQGKLLKSLTTKHEVLLVSGDGPFPPMLQYYSDRKEGPVCASPVFLARVVMLKETHIHGPVGGFLCSRNEVVQFLPTLDLLVKDLGWKGPIEVGQNFFWDAHP